MRRERVADDIFIFTSELYAQVTAGVIYTPDGSIVIDTMVFPEEARTIRRFVEDRLDSRVRYIINTHYHADHSYGNCFFDGAIILSHALTYNLLDTRGRASLEEARQQTSTFDEVSIRLPHAVFDTGSMELRLGNKTFELHHSPGHSPDSIVVLVKEDRVLFAGDTLMPVPFFVDGSYQDFISSLKALKNRSFENVIQGHGEVILRGEIEQKIDDDLHYMEHIQDHAKQALTKPEPYNYLAGIDIEMVGKSRIALNGGVEDLHQQNMITLYENLSQATPKKK